MARCRDWSSLPEIAVFDIATRLNPIELYSLAAVCKSWRSICTKYKAQINALQPPLLLFLNCSIFRDLRLRKSPVCEVYSFHDKRVYSKPLPNLNFLFWRTYGCFHGYIVGGSPPNWCSDRSCIRQLHLANPFTEDFITVPTITPHPLIYALITAPPSSTHCLVIAFTHREMMTFRLGIDDHWSVVPLPRLEFGHVQAVYFKGCVYILTPVSVMAVGIEPEVAGKQFPPFRIRDYKVFEEDSRVYLVAVEEELFVLHMELKNSGCVNKVYRLVDGENGIWEKVDDIGGRTLFATNCSGFVATGTQLLGWENRVFFTYPFCNIQVNGTAGPFLPADNFDGTYHWGSVFFAWVPPSQF